MEGNRWVKSAENQGRGIEKAARFGPLERALGLSHITFVQAATSVSEPEQGCTQAKARPDGGRVN
jgi:hypothetical protein